MHLQIASQRHLWCRLGWAPTHLGCCRPSSRPKSTVSGVVRAGRGRLSRGGLPLQPAARSGVSTGRRWKDLVQSWLGCLVGHWPGLGPPTAKKRWTGDPWRSCLLRSWKLPPYHVDQGSRATQSSRACWACGLEGRDLQASMLQGQSWPAAFPWVHPRASPVAFPWASFAARVVKSRAELPVFCCLGQGLLFDGREGQSGLIFFSFLFQEFYSPDTGNHSGDFTWRFQKYYSAHYQRIQRKSRTSPPRLPLLRPWGL